MKLVIDIPESRYRLLQKQARTKLGRENLDEWQEAVLNGTPLPKGHGDLKDVDALINKCAYDLDNHFVIDLIDVREAPIIIEADKGEQE